MKKKKGFTLIELLAVIVILALIALIASPKLLQVIEDSKERARMQSFRAFIKASDIYISQSIMFSGSLDGNLFDIVKDRVKGDKPDSGDVRYDKDLGLGITGEYDGYCYVKDFGSDEIYRDDNRENCVIQEELVDACVNHDERVLDINYDVCRETLLSLDNPYSEEDINKYCTGQKASDGYSIEHDINTGALEFFIDIGLINYTINKENCLSFLEENYSDISAEDGTKICTKEEASDGTVFENIIDDYGYIDLIMGGVIDYTKSTGNKVCNSCFQYQDNVVSYEINKSKCIEMYTNWGNPQEEAEDYCTYYEDSEGYHSLQEELKQGYLTYETVISNGVIYNVQYNGVAITGYNCSKGNKFGYPEKTEITIPTMIDNKKVITIGDGAFFDKSTWISYYVTNIDFSNAAYLESIGDSAFAENYLTSVDLSKLIRLKSIGDGAFEYGSIRNIKLPSSVEIIRANAFRNNEIEDTLDLSSLNNLKVIEYSAFTSNYIENLNLPDSLEEIQYHAFSDNMISGFLDLGNMNKLEFIGDSAFLNNNLSNVRFSKSLISIGDNAFENNPLETVVLSSNIEEIGYNAFRKDDTYNKLETIINRTGREFNWSNITRSNTYNQVFEVGTIVHQNGDINVMPYTMDELIYGNACYETRNNFTYDINVQACKTYYGTNSNITDLDSFCSGNAIKGADGNIYSIELELLNDDYQNLIDNNVIENIKYSDEYIITGYNCIGGDSGFPAIDIDKIPSTIEDKPVVAIANEAFMDLEFESIDLSEQTNLKIIGNSAFQTSNWQTPEIEIKLPSSLVTIGNNGFYYRELKSLDMSNLSNLKHIGSNAFLNSDIMQEVDTSNLVSLELLGNSVFKGNSFYGVLDLSNTKLITIPENAFYYNVIETIKLPKSIERIENNAFTYNALGGIRVENFQVYTGTSTQVRDKNYTPGLLDLSSYTNLKYIGKTAFETNQIATLKLPTSIIELGESSFASNKLVGVLDLSSNTNLTTIRARAFEYNSLTNAILPDSVINFEHSVFNKNNFEGDDIYIYARVDTNNDGKAEIDNTTIVSYASKNTNGLTLPSQIEHIHPEVFHASFHFSGTLDLSNLTNLKVIEDETFFNTNFSEVKLPANLERIGSNAFYNNYLTSVTIPDKVTSIGSRAFYYNSTLKTITIPNSVKTIGTDAFYGISKNATITIDNVEGALSGSPWGAGSVVTINYLR